ncbi:MAG: prepilin-type N-terminal cleavage/methylation domain-containing protein [Rhodanobacter sp.]
MTRRACRGFTLLEVLASLVLLALLMVGVYSGIRTASVTTRSGSAMIQRSDQIRAAQQFVRRELAQAMAQPLARSAKGEALVFIGSAREMRYVAPLPGYLGRLGPQLQRLQLVDDNAGGMRLELSLALLPPDGRAPQPLGTPQVLLDHISAGGFSYSGIDAQGAPVAWTDTWPDGRQLPRLVRVALRAEGNPAWPRLQVPIRSSAERAAANVGMRRMGAPTGNTQ